MKHYTVIGADGVPTSRTLWGDEDQIGLNLGAGETLWECDPPKPVGPPLCPVGSPTQHTPE